MATNCVRSRYTTSVTKSSCAAGESSDLSRAASVGAVMAGCLVATVQPSSMMTTKEMA